MNKQEQQKLVDEIEKRVVENLEKIRKGELTIEDIVKRIDILNE